MDTPEPEVHESDPARREFFLCWFDDGTRDIEACIREFGERAVFVETPELPEVGDKLTLLIQGTRRYTFSADGSVCWTSRAGDPPGPELGFSPRSGRSGFGFQVENTAGFGEFLTLCRAHRRRANRGA